MIILCMIVFCASAQAKDMPYTVKLDGEEKIYLGHGVDYGYSKQVGEEGIYTIVEEAYDEYGNLWGKLKSGAGWVRLTDAPLESVDGFFGDSYTASLDAWVPIYDSPSEMDGVCIGIIGEDGVFTIINEVQDELGNIWGELKSGAGWVNLNYIRYMGEPPITAYFADVIDQIDEDQCDCIVDDSEYMVKIAFRANERLKNVRFTTLQCGDGYEVEKNHHWIHWMEEDTYFVAGVVFYGDMTTYGISFVDEEGNERYYAVSLSGMNGALVLNEYVR